MDINLIVKISARGWSLRILALMHRGVPARQAPLLAQTQAGRTAFGQSLQHLIDLELIERNPGHGHPIRPEYRLTPRGKIAAAMADRIEAAVPGSTQHLLLRRAWTVPILSISQTPRAFGEIKSTLADISDRALSQSLKHLQEHAWVQRDVDTAANPPRPRYHAIGDGKKVGMAVPAQR